MRTAMRDRAATIVANNWRIRKRLPKLTDYAKRNGYISRMTLADWKDSYGLSASVSDCGDGRVLVTFPGGKSESELYGLADYYVYEDHAGYVSMRLRNR